MAISYVLTDDSASVFLDYASHAVPASHPNWTQIVELLANPDATEDDLRPLLDIVSCVPDYMGGAVEYRDHALFYNGKSLDTSLTRRIIQHMNANQPGLAAPLIKFFENVMLNPSRRAVLGLYDWVERSGLPITPDGHIMAYKIVNHNFTDCYTGTFDNSPGKIVSVERNEVDEDPEQTCSYGLHVCSAGYLPNYGGSNSQVVIVKINPADFVAVPKDYNVAKARVCRYEVLQAVPKETAATFFPNPHVYDPTPKIEFEVGQTWLTHNGDVVVIDFIDEDAEFNDNDAIQTKCGHGYASNGQYYYDSESGWDLVELMTSR